MDVMQAYFAYKDASAADASALEPHAEPLSNNEIAELRSMLFHGIKVMVQNEITEDEMRVLISFVLESPKAAEVIDVLHLILWLSAKSTSKTYTALKPLGGS
jgi:hypothetical protein